MYATGAVVKVLVKIFRENVLSGNSASSFDVAFVNYCRTQLWSIIGLYRDKSMFVFSRYVEISPSFWRCIRAFGGRDQSEGARVGGIVWCVVVKEV